MSWQATAWAVKRRVGSPTRKLLLLTLANYADDLGYCWPSQSTLSADTEQSADTIQRNLKRLAADGHLVIERRARANGRWPALAYRLRLDDLTIPQNAVRSGEERDVTQCNASGVDPGLVRHGHAAPHTATVPHSCAALTVKEPILEPEPPSSSAPVLPRAAKRSADEGIGGKNPPIRRERPEVVLHRIAGKLGKGDSAAGWLILGTLSDSAREYLTSCERRGELTAGIVDLHLRSLVGTAPYPLKNSPALGSGNHMGGIHAKNLRPPEV